MIRVFVPPNPVCGFLRGVSESLFPACLGFQRITTDPDSADVFLGSHYGDAPRREFAGAIVFFDGESGSSYSASRDAPLTAAFCADVYIGPRANHTVLQSRGIECEYVPFASLSFGERRMHTPLALVSRAAIRKPIDVCLCGYLASNPVDARENFFDELFSIAATEGQVVRALGQCAGSHGQPASVTRRFQDGYIDEAVRLLRQCRFAMAFENESVDGYVTEKLVNAYLAGCIPLYSGSSAAFEIFNRDSLIYIDDFRSFGAAVRYVMEVAKDERECDQLLSASPLAPGALECFFSWYTGVDGPLGERISDAVRVAVGKRRWNHRCVR